MKKQQRNRMDMRLVCLCLIFSMTLPLFGCGKEQTDTETAEAVQEVATNSGAESDVPAETEQQEVIDLQQVLTAEAEENVRELYLDKMALEAAVRTLVADRLNSTSFFEVDAREHYNITEVLIDEATGNPIISEGLKAMLKAAADEKPVSDIVTETVAGAASGVSDYLTGEIEGAITDALGVDIFSAVDFVNEWNNVDSTPTVLLENIVNDQKTDVAMLDAFLQQEEMNASDILKLSQLVYCIHVREREIHDITGEANTDSSSDYVQLEEIARQYAQLEEQIGAYAYIVFPEQVSQLTETEKSDIQAAQDEMDVLLNEAQQLNELSVGNIAVNYDVKGFKAAQESTAQTGLIAGAFLGNLLGSQATEDLQQVADWVQEKRGKLYNTLTGYMEESFQSVAEAKSQYDGKAAVLQWICDAQGDELYFAKCYLENADWQTEYESARAEYVDALEKYLFDLSCAYQFYECTLTQNQADFLFDIQLELDNVQACVDAWDAAHSGGYAAEEKSARYQSMIAIYVESVDYIQVRSGALGQTPGFKVGSDVTKYGEGTYHSYVNGDTMTLVIRLRTGEYIYGGGGIRSYYDMQGNPIYCSAGDEWVCFFNNEVMGYQLMNDDAVSSYMEYAQKSLAVFQ